VSVNETSGTDAFAQDAPGDEDKRQGLRFRLSEGAEESERRQSGAATTGAAPATKLSEAEASKVLQRLPPLKASEGDEQDFALREKSLPPPRAGQTVLAAFPAPVEREAPGAVASGPFEVVRYSPVGETPLAPQLSVTFSQPMVAISSQEEASREVPVRLSPQVEGRWRWLGTKTLIFDPAGERLPMATEFNVSVNTAARSASGGALKAPASWKFSTPPPQLKAKHPEGGPARRDAIMFVEFDQRVDPAAVLRSISVRAGGGAGGNLKVRLATVDEIAADPNVQRLSKAAVKERWLAFRALDAGGGTLTALPPASDINVSVGPGTPSAEGPRVTAKAQAFSFRTYGPLRVTQHRCGWQKQCSPFDQWQITFSNPLDLEAFQQTQVRFTPELPDAKIQIYGSTMYVQGGKRGRTVYKMTLDGALRDTFGQTLGQDVTLTFNVGSAPATLFGQGGNFVVLDPSTRQPGYSVYSINHPTLKVSLYAVRPEDWERYTAYMRHLGGYDDQSGRQKQTTPPGRLISLKTIAVAGQPDEMTETRLDLSTALAGGLGHVFVIVEPTKPPANGREQPKIHSWVQVTNIGLDAFVDRSELVGWATSLKDGQPLAGVELSLHPDGPKASSGGDGVVRLALPPKSATSGGLLVARRGAETAILPERADWWGLENGWVRREASDALRWYVFDDRKMYRPGEGVSVKGWIRRVGGGETGDVGALAGAVDSVSYAVRDARGNELTKGAAKLNALGGFDLSFKLPGTLNLGGAFIQLEAVGGVGAVEGRQHQHQFQVQEFRRPEFEVTAKASEGPHFVGSHAQATVSASYFAGGGLPNSEVLWRVTATPGHYTPPNRDDYTFGKWIPWWGGRYSSARTGGEAQVFGGRTDAAGNHRLRIDFEGVRPPQASSVTAQASVTDVNRQTWTATTTMLVHPADLYVGLRSDRTFVQQGEPLVVQSIVTDLDGRAVEGREVKMSAVLLDWVFTKGEWRQEDSNREECSVRSTAQAVSCTFRPKKGGVYRVTATVLDDRERPNESELTLWVAGGKQPPRRDVSQETVELIPDRKEYRAGDTAEVLLQSPFFPAEGVLTLRRSGLLRTEHFHLDGPSHTLRIPVEEGFTPNVHMQVDLVGAATRMSDAGEADEKLPKRPAFAKGTLNLPVPPLARKLQVTATPRDRALEPGGETTVGVEVRDAAGRAVQGSELAVVVVDEAVLALTGYQLADPVSVFYAQRGAEVGDYHLRANVLLEDPSKISIEQSIPLNGQEMQTMSMVMPAPGLVGAGGSPSPQRSARRGEASTLNFMKETDEAEGASAAIRLRSDFNALAVFAPSVVTDSEGRAEVKVKVPDSLTRYRVMAVSVAGGRQFGKGESAITARMPLMVRPSAPRFLNFGDRFELPVVLQNQTDKPLEVSVAVRASNAALTDGSGRRVTVPANDRVEVRFPTEAEHAGKARFQFAAASGRHSDAAEIELPVWTPATTEAFATYGELDQSGAIVQPVKAPPNVFPQFGGLEVTTSSTQLQALTDAVLYLVSYPYECSEQLSSRVLAVAALRDVLTAFKAKDLPSPDAMKAAVGRDLKRLQGMQNGDGGFGFWRRGEESWPYVSIHVAHALTRAKEKGFDVPDDMLGKSKSYLRDIERHIPRWYGDDARNALIAYALNVRARMGDRDAARARRLIASPGLEKLSLEALGWLLPVLSGDAASTAEVAAIRRHFNNRVTETAGAAHFVTSYADGDYLLLHSSRRADGVILEALIGVEPQSDLIPKLVRGLLAHRKQGRWENTQENVFILLALDRYFNTYEKTTPDFVARAWLGEAYAGEQQFRGRSVERRQFNVPMSYLSEKQGTQNLTLSKEGAGRLYYRVGMQYAPASLKLAAADYGFTVERVYESLGDPSDVRRDADGTWRIKSGSKVRVRLTLGAPARRYHVALVDPLPAGLEVLNPALAVSETLPPDQKAEPARYGWWWVRPWFEHQNMRDERVEAFASLLWDGVYNYSYVARATTPGNFVVPPPKAEEMYHPETFGRGSTDRVIVE
jgi:uncharacterized protein YfaS (alpha-2-macroglobulin family)